MSYQESKKTRISATEDNPLNVILAKNVVVATYNPDITGMEPPKAVHMYIHVEGIDEPIAIIFDHPRQLTTVLRELSSAGKAVWPTKKERQLNELFVSNHPVA
jgi:hypothetical protein